MSKAHISSGGRYPVLRALAILYLICGAAAAVVGVIAALFLLVYWPDKFWGRAWVSLQALGWTALVVIACLTLAEAIKLFIDMAGSLRRIATGGSAGAAAGPADDGAQADETAEAALFRGD